MAPHPLAARVRSPYSNSMSSLTLPEIFLKIHYLTKVHLPLKSIIIGLFAALYVLRTKTTLLEGGKIVVGGTVEEVTAGVVVFCNAVDVTIVGDVVVSKQE